MMRREKIIYSKKHQGLDGDSGVGQASEFPSKPFLKGKQYSSRDSASHSIQMKAGESRSMQDSSRLGTSDVPPSNNKSSPFTKHIGTFLILFSLVAFLITYGPILKVEMGYRLSRLLTKTPKSSFANLLDKTLLGDITGVPDPEFSLIIPKIRASGKIVKDVDASNYTEYMQALQSGVAHAKGTRLPGEEGTMYLFAHSTDNQVNVVRYNAIFYLLRELEPGDEIDVYYKGARHVYVASEKRIVAPTDTAFLNSGGKEQKETLILQTCFPPGTTWKRLLIIAEKKGEMEEVEVDK